MKLIVAVDRHWGIGKDNKLLFSLKTDMAFFKKTTTGKIVVMGKNTFLSFPGGPLKNRINVVLTKENFQGCICVKSMDELMRTISKYDRRRKHVSNHAAVLRNGVDYQSRRRRRRRHILPESRPRQKLGIDTKDGGRGYFPDCLLRIQK